MNRGRHHVRWGALLVLLMGCDDSARAIEPVWNKQPCAHCHMLLSEPRYAAQLVTAASERLYFDDVGCMAAYAAEHTTSTARAWVRQGTGWVLASSARFAPNATTPMGYGFVPDRAGALDLAAVMRAVAEPAAQGATR